MHLRQPGFTYRACGSFKKSYERIQKFKETGIHDIFQKLLKESNRRVTKSKGCKPKKYGQIKAANFIIIY